MSLLLSLAFAGPEATPVVYDGGDGAEHVAAVMARSGLPADQLRGVPMAEVFQRPPVTLGEAVVRRCATSPATLAEARGDFVRAEAALASGDDLGAADYLDLSVAKLGCLSEVVDGPTASKVFLLRGALAAADGREDEAAGELRTALSLHPEAAWPPGYPVEGSHVLAQVLAEEERFTLHVTPKSTSGPWIDGRDIGDDLTVRRGLHLAQHSARTGLSTAWLVVGGDATWALPDALPTSALDRFVPDAQGVSDPGPVAHVVAGAFPDAAAVYVSHRSGLWLVQGQGATATVTELTAPAPPEPEPEPEPEGKGKKKRNK
jgi:hypothetical protein